MMRHRILTAAVVIIGLAATVQGANERVTLIMADGSRHTGEVASRGPQGTNIVDTYFFLNEERENRYPVEQVAIVDFSGGQPRAEEFDRLRDERGAAMVMRGGGVVRGRLANLVNGDTIKWENEAGQLQQFAIRDVDRIYLNPRAARRLYPQLAGSESGARGRYPQRDAQGTNGSFGQSRPGSVRVNANEPFVSTGVLVRQGQLVAFSATGQVHFSPAPEHVSGPDGNPAVQTGQLPVPGMSVGGLIGRVGNATFAIGSNRQPIRMTATGPLLLGVNDTITEDNSGAFTVVVSPIDR